MENRREFLQKLAAVGIAVPASTISMAEARESKIKNTSAAKIGPVCVFSKHLQFLDYEEMAEASVEVGFGGVEMTVRPGGHVVPERVEEDLPEMVKAIKDAGLVAPMMVTGIDSAMFTNAEITLKLAAELGVKYYRLGYMRHDWEQPIEKNLKEMLFKMKGLNVYNKKYDIQGSYQNHDGTNLGGPIWDLWYLLMQLDSEMMGCQYDIRHNIVEGAHSWPVTLRLISPYINTLVAKDHYWAKIKGKWRIINCPLGEGMVDFDAYFKLVRELGVGGPITMHFEYPMTSKPEKEMKKADIRKQVLPKMKKDLDFLNGMLTKYDLK
ncbi:sugar phosphate isomerase/epimerase family protein [Bacteroidota bacterium]